MARSDARTSHDPLVAPQNGLLCDRLRGRQYHDGDAVLVVATLALGADVSEAYERCGCGRLLPFAARLCFTCAARRVEISLWFGSWTMAWRYIGKLAAHELREGRVQWRSLGPR